MQPWSLSEEEQKGLGDFLMGNWEKRNFLALILLKITTRSKRSLLWEKSFTALWRDVSGRRELHPQCLGRRGMLAQVQC